VRERPEVAFVVQRYGTDVAGGSEFLVTQSQTALSVFFGALAVGEERWGLLAAMVLLAVTAVGLFVVQWRLLKRITNVNKRP